jgi:[ribosomal protein S5]-alanine N-acetyltransferase
LLMQDISNFKLKFVWVDNPDLIKQLYIWDINEDEKNKSTFQNCSNVKQEYSEEGLKQYENRFIENRGQVLFYILEKIDTGEMLGSIELQNYNHRNHSASIGSYFPKENRGKGFGSIIMQLFLPIVLDDDFYRPLNKIDAETSSFNISAMKVLENFGFRQVGQIPEHYWFGEQKYDQMLYSLLKRDYTTHITK